MEITQTHLEKIYQRLDMGSLPASEKTVFTNYLGKQILEVAMLRFVSSLGEWEHNSFDSWVAAHSSETDLLEQAVKMYPDFGKMLTEEILLLKDSFEINK